MIRVVWVLFGIASCAGSSDTQRPVAAAPAAPACLADVMPKALDATWTMHPECETERAKCRDACSAGDRSSCFHLAVFLDVAKLTDDAKPLHTRACELGLSIACVNVGAHIWSRTEQPEPLACARRIFAKTCDTGDSMGCAMVGRMMVENGTAESRAEARRYFESTCEAMKGPPCRMLAYYLEEG